MPSGAGARREVWFTNHARREFEALPEPVQDRFRDALEMLEVGPFDPRPGCDVRPLQARGGAWGLRVGRYRGIYEVVGSRIWFTTFDRRDRVYR